MARFRASEAVRMVSLSNTEGGRHKKALHLSGFDRFRGFGMGARGHEGDPGQAGWAGMEG
jgi:hypothetical protein